MSKLLRVIGVGNPLMGDDGLGIAAIEQLKESALANQLELIDGGCGGLSLLHLLDGADKVVIIDAADFSAQPGSIRRLTSSDLPPEPTTMKHTHQLALPELLKIHQSLPQAPEVVILLMQVESCQPKLGLSAAVAEKLPQLNHWFLNALLLPP